ncbi:MAG: type ISP restriction/modification enzyme [Tepidisphaerales bacterium]
MPTTHRVSPHARPIFHYADCHSSRSYREKFADNLKRELPRIPFAPPSAAGVPTGR